MHRTNKTSIRGRLSANHLLVLMIVLGLTTANLAPFAQQPSLTVTNGLGNLTFDVSTVKPTDPQATGWRMEFLRNGFTAHGVTLRVLMQEALNAYEPGRLIGGAPWLNSEKFDVEARVDPADAAEFSRLSLPQRRTILEAFLEKRFGLILHRGKRNLPELALRVTKGGPHLQAATSNEFADSLVTRSARGLLEGRNFNAKELANVLESVTEHVVVDQTDVDRRFDFLLRWAPDDELGVSAIQKQSEGSEVANYPSLFTALKEQLGLELAATQGTVDVFVIDSAELPSSN